MQWSCVRKLMFHPPSALVERGEAGISVRIDDTAIFVENPKGSEVTGEVLYDAIEEYEITDVGRGE